MALSRHTLRQRPVVLGFALFGASLWMQAQTAPLNFEVASVKPATSGLNGYSGGCHGIDSTYTLRETASAPPLGRCVIHDARLSHLMVAAYNLRSMEFFKSGPDWVEMGGERFDVDAKAEDPAHTTEAQLLEMLQNLLIDRFQVKFHRESKQVPGFALVVAKNGPKLRPDNDPAKETRLAGSFKVPKGAPIVYNATKYSMTMFAAALAQIGRGPVVDETGLKGTYDFKLTWNEEDGPTLFTALNEQLGLKFEPRKLPVSILVVDSAQRPSAN